MLVFSSPEIAAAQWTLPEMCEMYDIVEQQYANARDTVDFLKRQIQLASDERNALSKENSRLESRAAAMEAAWRECVLNVSII